MDNVDLREEMRALSRRLERLESIFGLAGVEATPGFDAMRFQRILMGYLMLMWVFFIPVFLSVPLAGIFAGRETEQTLLGLPLFSSVPKPEFYSFSLGIVSFGGGSIGVIALGGLAIGVVAFGGGAIGIFAIGGGAFGVFAVGGGAVGLFAFGGGALGYIAIGGGAFGKYVLAGDGRGRYVFDRRRQDEEAVRLFIRFFPRLRQAFTDVSM